MSLKVIALISGGKDSLYSLAHCLQNGHTLVALANLHPSPGGAEDLNSFMYQTVGHDIIPFYEQALELPLYRRHITGSAIQTGRYYDTSTSSSLLDETEDLVPLLKAIVHDHPEANAISSGAILSTYQRTRIESIALRLDLTPLAYLWQYPALPPPSGRDESLTGLLDDMAAAGCEARIIKIASGGIKDSWIWSDLMDSRTRTRVLIGMTPYFGEKEFWLRGAVLGEGGEYETIALDGPSPLWKKRIIVEEDSTVSHEGATYAKLSNGRLVEKNDNGTKLVPTPMMLDLQWRTVQRRINGLQFEQHNGSAPFASPQGNPEVRLPDMLISELATAGQHNSPDRVCIANITSASMDAVDAVQQQLQNLSFTTDDIISTTLLLSNMSDFAQINTIYSRLFTPGLPNPPARITIACDLPADTAFNLSLICSRTHRSISRGLHVQSRSYWAPANIGPYSQAICVPLHTSADSAASNIHDADVTEAVHVAGQIPLVSDTMELLNGRFLDQAVLSLQHLWRVGQERDVDAWTWGVAFFPADAVYTDLLLAAAAWEFAHQAPTRTPSPDDNEDDDDTGPDIWDIQHNRAFSSSHVPMTVGQHLHILPHLAAHSSLSHPIPPFIAAEVKSLPRSASIEWWSLGLAHITDSSLEIVHNIYPWGRMCISNIDSQAKFITVMVKEDTTLVPNIPDLLKNSAGAGVWEVAHGTAYVTAKEVLQLPGNLFSVVAVIPCKRVWGAAYPFKNNGSDSKDVSTKPESLRMAMTMRVDRPDGQSTNR